MAELANCPNCGQLFLKDPMTVCKSCYDKEEEQFQVVYKFIQKKKNRTAQVHEVAEATDVKESLIRKWVKERRIHPVDFPNFTYECERCGNPIQEGNICDSCRDELHKDMQLHEQETLSEQNDKNVDDVYYNVTKERKWRR